jgi:hypothetical protein
VSKKLINNHPSSHLYMLPTSHLVQKLRLVRSHFRFWRWWNISFYARFFSYMRSDKWQDWIQRHHCFKFYAELQWYSEFFPATAVNELQLCFQLLKCFQNSFFCKFCTVGKRKKLRSHRPGLNTFIVKICDLISLIHLFLSMMQTQCCILKCNLWSHLKFIKCH